MKKARLVGLFVFLETGVFDNLHVACSMAPFLKD